MPLHPPATPEGAEKKREIDRKVPEAIAVPLHTALSGTRREEEERGENYGVTEWTGKTPIALEWLLFRKLMG